MILEIEYYKGDVFLTGKNISESTLRKHIVYVQRTFDRENDNFTELLCRCFDWEILSYDGIPDYTYDRDIEKLKKTGNEKMIAWG